MATHNQDVIDFSKRACLAELRASRSKDRPAERHTCLAWAALHRKNAAYFIALRSEENIKTSVDR